MPLVRNPCNTRIGCIMRYLMSDAEKVHTNPDPSQSSVPKVSFPVPQIPMPNHDWSGIQRSGLYESKRNWSLNNKLHITRSRESVRPLTEGTTVPCTHTSKSRAWHCVSPGLILQFMTATSRMGTLY
jgi:hypothetical protein